MVKFTNVKSKNKNGFAMAELLAVCIVVLSIFTILFSNYLPLVAEYENRSVYNNVTAQYAVHHFRKAYADAIVKIGIVSLIDQGIEDKGYFSVYEKDNNGEVKNEEILNHININDKEETIKLLNEYAIEEMIITKYKLSTDDKKGLKDKLGSDDGGYPENGKLYGYIKYLPTYKNYNGEETYRIILKSSEFGYATTAIKYEDTSVVQGPNHPVLSENMIAVRYFTGTEGSVCDSGNSCWKVVSDKEEDKDNWYNYDNGEWANSITVKSDVRDEYSKLESNGIGKDVDIENDVLTMQVWIPRFKYTVWNYNMEGLGNNEKKEFSIEIEFEKDVAATGTITCAPNLQGANGDGTSEICKQNREVCTNGTCNGKTYTHPAFTFGDESLTGFWVGKFELTGTVDRITTKPNLQSLRYLQVGAFDHYLRGLNDIGDNIYGFTNSDDTHMIKNMEWGAITYLSHSKYGINKKISFNSNNSYKTGCGPQSSGSISWGSDCNGYDTTLGESASTTGNIYGVYDMSGGSWEYVMGNMVNSENNNIISGHYQTDNSGYNGILYDYDHDYVVDNTLYEGIYQYPTDSSNKYVDKYSYGTTSDDRTAIKRSKLGDSIKEMTKNPGDGWYNDDIKMIYVASKTGSTEGNAWIRRGGGIGYSAGSSSYGLFSAESDSGGSRSFYTSRIVIAVIK